MVRLAIDLPEDVLGAMRRDPAALARDMRLAAAAKWYELRMVSQETAAEIAGVSRSEFVQALSRWGISPFQYEPGELTDEVSGI